jgi:blue copper oxidase
MPASLSAWSTIPGCGFEGALSAVWTVQKRVCQPKRSSAGTIACETCPVAIPSRTSFCPASAVSNSAAPARQVYLGLTGLIIIDDGSDATLGLPRTYGFDDLPIILQDRSFDSDGSLLYDLDLDPLTIQYGLRGDTIIANGVIAPVAKVPGGLVRLRILNAANAQNFDLRFSDRRDFHVIASDAGFLPTPAPVKKLRISPAERFEILIDFANLRSVMLETGPDAAIGIFGAVSQDGTAEFVPIMRFEPTATPAAVKEIPLRLVEPAAASLERAVRRREFLLDSGICGGQRPRDGRAPRPLHQR